MPVRLSLQDPGFEQKFAEWLAVKREVNADVDKIVADILADILARGDTALFDYTARFDRFALTADTIRVRQAEIDQATDRSSAEARKALELAARRIEDFHVRHRPRDDRYTDANGIELGCRWNAIEAVGLYVPGGKAAYPSSLLMNAVPAQVAGVRRRVMVMPTPDGQLNPLLLAAAKIAGLTEIYRIGGAQAIGALAFGTKTIAPVDKIVGPGNAYVAAAKKQVFGKVGIDMIAGPSEILVVADGKNDPAWIAADLLAQAEHDEAAQSILMADDASFADAVEGAITAALAALSRRDIAAESWRRYGAIILLPKIEDAVPLIDQIAPEHLALALDQPEALFAKIRHAGSVFLGRLTPEALGDYVAGPNHVLPTGRSARFSSGLSVLDFMKRSTFLQVTAAGLAAIGPAAITLAEAEGLPAHARSVSIRLKK